MLALRSLRLVSGRPPVPGRRNKFSLPDLPYDYHALEPVISAEIMEIHHSKHHRTFVDNLNELGPRLEEAVARQDVTAVIQMQKDIRFNGGGHTNHSIWWQLLCPGGSDEPEGDLAAAIVRDFGSFASLKAALSGSAVGVQGSSWCWLGYDRGRDRMEVRTCANQDPLEATTGEQSPRV